ncbi:MAG: proline--tRNA ligase [Deltaproteobacteria bacterium RIFCSPLOWO2_02_FULL_44_10]|nr:MAG: proline--tRNA ligase [Deltaproteobacteria bacterium RIFCSPHIGHO2_02_FULL_44_16]OGQ45140.1 MAG: proline--tRNA ligase [Deltaproteobacteria bacterium RIFCSPLOWO2_02_FULL_44_10]
MRYSELLIPTLREAPSDAEVISHQLMLRAGYIRKLAAGVYTYLPLCLRVLRKIEGIIRSEMEKSGAHELLLPIVMPAELWKESKRWDVYGKELLRFKDRHDREFCVGPTHEEAITDLARREIRSYRDLPKNLFQIQTKFRDEIRPRFGLMRGREFIMKDSYSFDRDEPHSLQTYQKMYEAYIRIFKRCGLDFRAVEAATGAIGGTKSHEFQVLAASGEDQIFACTKCEYAINSELKNSEKCPRCQSSLENFRGIEVGQVFFLGTKYSEAMKANFLDEKGNEVPLVMGCYGIGIGRTAAAAIEQNHDERGIIWPLPIAPFQIEVIPLGTEFEVLEVANKIAQEIQAKDLEPLLDDRDERPGVKFADADLIGIPYQVVVGSKGLKEGVVEWKERKTGTVEKVKFDHVRTHFLKIVK